LGSIVSERLRIHEKLDPAVRNTAAMATSSVLKAWESCDLTDTVSFVVLFVRWVIAFYGIYETKSTNLYRRSVMSESSRLQPRSHVLHPAHIETLHLSLKFVY
jgi:hypothetical protein